ncbi:HK97 family phage prohead protease [Microbacterium arborescens]
MTDIERRVVDRPVELRAAPEGSSSPGTLIGYGAVFNSASRDLGGWSEEIDPGAFGEPGEGGALDLALHTRVMARAEHDSRLLLGATDSGTLRLFVDEIGLRYEVDLPNTSAGRDVAELARRGDYRYSSFAFALRVWEDAEWREDRDGHLVRRVMRARLIDVAPVADPAYWGASAQMRSAVDLDAVRAALTPPPAVPGEWETAAVLRSASKTRETHPALVTRPRNRGI